jgi:hypothetical protein
MFKRLFKGPLFHLILIAVIAALGIAVKPIVVPLAQAITGPFLPGGAAAGGIYMLFLVLAVSLTGMRGAGTLCGLCQALLVLAMGIAGSHGAMSLLTYTLPGLAVDLVFLPLLARRQKREANLPACFFGGILANVTGTIMVNLAFFSLPVIPLLLSLCLAAFSGGIGGAGAFGITKTMKKWSII